jgi:addiction module RelE/StbE family toxin
MNQPIRIEYSKRFQKQYAKLGPNIREQFEVCQRLWITNPDSSKLRLHKLRGDYAGFYSININGDIRALYKKISDNYVIFGFIGTHSQLYG